MSPPAPARRLRAPAVAGGLALGVLGAGALGLGVLWAQRNAVGVRLAQDYLRREGVPARVRLDRLDAGGAAGSFSLGPAAAPDLQVDHFEAGFEPMFVSGRPWGAPPRLRTLRLVRPRLRARWDGRRLSFGSLQRLVDEAAAAPPGGGPAPDLDVVDGRLDLVMPWGRLGVGGNARFVRGRLARADLRLPPVDLGAQGGPSARALGGSASAVAVGADRMRVRADLAAVRLVSPASRLDVAAPHFRLDVTAPYPRSGPLRGAVAGRLDLAAAALRAPAGQAVRPAGRLEIDGRWDGGAPAYDGRLDLFVGAASAWAGGVRWSGPALHLASGQASVGRRAGAVSASGPIRVQADAAGGGSPQVRFGPLHGVAAGPIGWEAGRARFDLALSARGEGGLSAAAARRAAVGAAALAPVLPDAQARAAAALGRVALTLPAARARLDARGGLRLDLPRPVQARLGAGAATVELAAANGPLWRAAAGAAGAGEGAFALVASGPGLPRLKLDVGRLALRGDRLEAAGALALAGDLGRARGLDLAVRGALSRAGGRTTARLAVPATLTLASLNGADGALLLRGAAVRLRPVEAPLLELDASNGWRVRAAVAQAGLVLPSAQVRLADASARLDFAGGAGRPAAGRVALDHAGAFDLAPVPRLRPITARGEARLDRSGVQAALDLALLRGGVGLGRAVLHQDPSSGVGEARWSLPALAFAPGGLQPADLAPAARPFASDVRGTVAVEAAARWARAEPPVASARVASSGLDLRSPVGMVHGLRGVLDLPSLLPLAAGPQHLEADRLDLPVPLTALAADLAFAPGRLEVTGARAVLADGVVRLDALVVPLTPGARLSSVLHLERVDLGRVLSGFNLSQAVTAQARLTGAVPFSFGPQGLRIANGRVAADGPGRLSVRRAALEGASATTGPPSAPGSPAVAKPPATGAVQDFAYQALEDLAFDRLDAVVDSRPGGRLGVVFHAKGRHDPPKAPPPPRFALVDLLRGRAFDKPIPLPKGTPVDLTLDTSLNFDDLLAAYGRLGRDVAGAGGAAALRAPGVGSAPVQP